MKTPEEWVKKFARILIDGPSYEFNVQLVRDIQSEAFLEGQLKGLEDGKQATMKVIDEVFGTPVKSELTSID